MRVIALALTLLTALATSGTAKAQDVAGAFGAMMEAQLSERWRASGMAYVAHQSGSSHCALENVTGGIEFHLIGLAYVQAEAKAFFSQYFKSDNRDIDASLTEAIMLKSRNGLTAGLQLEQKRLYFSPSDYSVTATRATPLIEYRRVVGSGYWTVGASIRTHFNLQAEVSDVQAFQRCRMCVMGERFVTHGISIGFRYEYMKGGAKQPYIGERDNMHLFTTLFTIRPRHNKSTR